MSPKQPLSFGPYRFDPQTGQLWRGKQEVRLTGKASALLRQLAERAGQLVTKAELFAAVWPETVVSDAALASCIQELRQALQDDPKQPRYLKTIHRRGFEFIGKVVSSQQSVASRKRIETGSSSFPSQDSALRTQPSVLVGRETELAQLHGWLAKALSGERQLVFVTGEPGIGKTTLIEAFLSGVRDLKSHEENQKSKGKGQKAKISLFSPAPSTQHLAPNLWLGWGQCIEHYGAGEAYLPVLEALGRLCREAKGRDVIALLRQQAPTWLVQMPALLSTAELEELQRRTAGVTRERMLRELVEALEALTAERPLILWFEDLHWSDVSTLDWLAAVARRQERARLLILGTYRPVEVLTREHPLKGVKQELQLHGQCKELALDFLSEGDVAEYLAVRFSAGARRAVSLEHLAHTIHQRTDGNPLFMVTVTNELVAQGVITQHAGFWELQGKLANDDIRVPENLRQLIEQQIERVSPEERTILEAASVAGAEFSAVAVAAGAEQSAETIEVQCDALVRREQFLRPRGTSEWPDGTIAARYRFVHALYQEVLYRRISASRRVRLHRQIGEREEAGYGERTREIAPELAVHFERGRDYARAVWYLQLASENAVRRSAHQEAISLLTKGLELLKASSELPERLQHELALQTLLGSVFQITKDQAAPETGVAFRRAYELCQHLEDTPQLFPTLAGLRRFYAGRGELHTARELAQQMLTIAQRVHDPALLVEAHHALGNGLFWLGEFVAAQAQVEQGIAVHDPQQHRSLAFVHGIDPGVQCRNFAAYVLWVLGYPDQALQRSPEALTLARELAHPPSQAIALNFASILHQLRRDEQLSQGQAEAVIALSIEHGFALFLAFGAVLRGWALTEQGQGEEGIAQMHQGLIAMQASGRELGLPHCLALLAEAHGKVGQAEEGLTVLAEALALVDKNGECYYEAEMYRLKGELLLAQEGYRLQAIGHREKTKRAEACFLKAIDLAHQQQAKSWELRATTSLARLWKQQGRTKQAHKMLVEIYNWFTEGFDTKDLQEAKVLIEELRH